MPSCVTPLDTSPGDITRYVHAIADDDVSDVSCTKQEAMAVLPKVASMRSLEH